jgi:hypothetical protein
MYFSFLRGSIPPFFWFSYAFISYFLKLYFFLFRTDFLVFISRVFLVFIRFYPVFFDFFVENNRKSFDFTLYHKLLYIIS